MKAGEALQRADIEQLDFGKGDGLIPAIVQRPRFGLFGGARNHLVIGMPLMMALDRQRFLAVLAHEYGHLRGDHGRFHAWVYRARASWNRHDHCDATCRIGLCSGHPRHGRHRDSSGGQMQKMTSRNPHGIPSERAAMRIMLRAVPVKRKGRCPAPGITRNGWVQCRTAPAAA